MDDIKFYFPNVTPDKLHKLRLSEEGKYSITKPNQGYQIANIIKKYIPNSKSYNFLDGTAGMGGDLYYIAPFFNKSIGVEKNNEHAKIAHDNLEVLGINVTVHNMSIIEYLSSDITETKNPSYLDDFPNGIDVLWIDPPWGGPDYKKHHEIDLFLDGKNIVTYVKGWFADKIAKVIFIKAPVNYNMTGISELGYKYKRFEISSKHKIAFIIIMVW